MQRRPFDVQKKFVRVVELRPDGFVEFEFAVGEPELYVEMVLPPTAFDDFCAANRVTFLDGPTRLVVGQVQANDWNWSLRDATHQRFKPVSDHPE